MSKQQEVTDSFVTIDDATDDFDYPADFEEWKRRYLEYVSRKQLLWRSRFS